MLSCRTQEIAEQITLRDWELWSKIKPSEFFGLGWTKETKLETSPNVVAMTAWFNELSNWVVSALCTSEQLKERVYVFEKLLMVADHLRTVGNYNGLMAIVSGLDRGPVYRLKLTLEVRPLSPLLHYIIYSSALLGRYGAQVHGCPVGRGQGALGCQQ